MRIEIVGTRASDDQSIRMRGEVASFAVTIKRAGERGIHVTSAQILGENESDQVARQKEVGWSEAVSRRRRRINSNAVAGIACLAATHLFLMTTPLRGEAEAIPDRSSPIASSDLVVSRMVFVRVPSSNPSAKDQLAWVAGRKHDPLPNLRAGVREGPRIATSGYVLRDKQSLATTWRASEIHPEFPIILSALLEGEWLPDPGYEFVHSGQLSARWQAKLPHAEHLHIRSSESEGRWNADPGYYLPGIESLQVAWGAGQRHAELDHIHSSNSEQYWNADPGYMFADGISVRTTWSPGRAHPTATNVVAEHKEGNWKPPKGYCFANENAGELSVLPNRSPRVEEAVGNALGSLVAHAFAQAAAEEQTLAGNFFAVIAIEPSQEAPRGTIRSAYPNASARLVVATSDLIGKIADGCLTAGDRMAAHIRSYVLRRLRADDSNAAEDCELAEFICLLSDRHAERHR